MNNVLRRSMSVAIAIVLTLGGFLNAGASPASPVNPPSPWMTSVNSDVNMIPSRTTTYYLADRVIKNADFAKLAAWGINTAVVDFDVNGSASDWRAVFTSAAATNINIVIWPSDWNNPRPRCGWEAPYPVSATGDITKVKRLLDVASQYSNFIGIVNAHESFWTCDMSFDEMAGLKDQLKAYALSKGRSIKVWNYIDNLYDKSMLPDNQIERIMDVAMTWQHCAGNVEGTCTGTSSTSALNMILNDRKRIADSGAQVELVFIIQTFTTNGYSTKFTLNQLQDYGCQFLNTSALDGFGFYTWDAGWWSDLHSWPELQPAVPYIYNSCINGSGSSASPTLIAPPDGHHEITLRPSFDWEDVSGATSYGLQISTDPSFKTTKIIKKNGKKKKTTGNVQAITTVDSSYTPEVDLAANTLYYWRVRSNGNSGSSDWSEVRTFITANPPSSPVLIFPSNNALLTNYAPLLNWVPGSLPLGSIFDHYQLQLDDDPAFGSPLVDTLISDVAITQLQAPSLPSNSTFYWRMFAFNTEGESSCSPTVTFRTALTLPNLLAPDNGNQENTLHPLLDWEDVNGATGYSLQISTDPSFTMTKIVKKNGKKKKTTVSVPPIITIDSSYTPDVDLPASTLFYWRVQANGVNGPSEWSEVRTFITP